LMLSLKSKINVTLPKDRRNFVRNLAVIIPRHKKIIILV
jgi:hypothetical protein